MRMSTLPFILFRVYDGACYATRQVSIQNMEAPKFSVSATPTTFCNDGSSEIKLNATSTDALVTEYYLKKNGVYPSASWDGSEKSINPTDYLESNNIYVRSRESRRYGETITDATIDGKYCSAQVAITLNASIPPVINYGLYDATATNENKTGAVCAR